MPEAKKQSALDPSSLTARTGTAYPSRFAGEVTGREKRALGDAFGLTQFGVNLTRLPPGCWSSHRHWHESEDELVYVLEGELVLIDDDGEHPISAGMCIGWKAGAPNGHHLINRSNQPATYLEIGTRARPLSGSGHGSCEGGGRSVESAPQGWHAILRYQRFLLAMSGAFG
jgi:uncharacterized cupin superfamily protein